MSARIPVLLQKNPYEVIVGEGVLRRTGEFVRQIFQPRKCVLVTDGNVAPLYAEAVERSLAGAGFESRRITVAAGEASKSMSVVEEVCDKMIAAGLDRKGLLLGLGGGVVGDLSGFAASIFYRGIPHVQIPTTVMAQVDSSVGGKTGVNSKQGKNLIGTFHQPSLVIADPEALKTLPKREFNEGFAEIIKHAAIRDPELLGDALQFQSREISSIIARNVQIKAKVVAEDEFETLGVRALLNFGHTIGHAVENCAGYGKYLHGEAVSLGLVAAIRLSEKKAGLPREEAERLIAALRTFELPVRLPDEMKTDELLAVLARDKKFEQGAIRFVLVPRLGSGLVSHDVTAEDIREAIEGLREG